MEKIYKFLLNCYYRDSPLIIFLINIPYSELFKHYYLLNREIINYDYIYDSMCCFF